MKKLLLLLLLVSPVVLHAQNTQNSQILSSYTSCLISTNLGVAGDVPAFSGQSVANSGTKLNSWFWEPLKGRHYAKFPGNQGRTFYAHAGGVDCLRVSVLAYRRPVVTKRVVVRTEQEFIDVFNNLQSGTAVWIAPGVYRIQQEKLHQHVFTDLENIQILAKDVVVSGFKADKTSSVPSHQTQAFGLEGGEWKRMNPKNPVGPGAAVAGSVDWIPEAIDASPVLGFMVLPDGSIKHNAEDVKVSNEKSPNLWKFTHCRNIHIQDMVVEGYNSVFPNYSAIGCVAELQGCNNIHFLRCKFDRNGGAAVSVMNTQRICNLIWFHQCESIDHNDELTYFGMRHAGHARASGLLYFNNALNCSVTECKFIGVYYSLLDINGINNDYVSNYFERVRNHPLAVHGMTGYGFLAWKNTFVKCGNPLPSNEELAQVGPSFWCNNSAVDSGWLGPDDVLKFKGMSGSSVQGNRLGGTSTFRLLGGIHVYDNDVHVAGVDSPVDKISTTGLVLGDRAFSRFVAKGNRWSLTNTGPVSGPDARNTDLVRHYETGAKTEHLANNLQTIEWGADNVLEWDRPGDKMVFFGQRSLTAQEFYDWLQSAKQ